MNARKPSRRRKWLFRLAAATLVPACFFGLLELVLRVCGYGYSTSFFVPGSLPGEETVYIENREFGRRFFPPALVKRPLPLTVPLAKAPGTCRIFVLGESAAMGFPDLPSSFARILETMLEAAYSDTRFEVINTAMTAINSNVVLPIAQDCARHEPDFFVVFMGNNEVIGPFGAAGVLGAESPGPTVIRANLAVKQARTGQLLSRLLQGLRPAAAPQSWEGMATFSQSQVSIDDPRLKGTHDTFRRNLEDICQAGAAAGAQVLVCTVPVNLRDCAPFGSAHRSDLSAESLAAWAKAYQEGIRLEGNSKPGEAIVAFEAATAIDDVFAELHYRLSRCPAAQGNETAAQRHYRQARDLDTLRFRTDSKLNGIIREVVGVALNDRVHLIDVEAAFTAISPGGVPGEELFLEHVHLKFAGNYQVARCIFETMAGLLPGARDGARPLGEAECAQRLAYTETSRLKAEQGIRRMMRDPPFTEQCDRAERDQRWDARLAKLEGALGPPVVKESIAACRAALERKPSDWMIREMLAQLLAQSGATAEAIDEYRTIVRLVPHYAGAYQKLGTLLVKSDPDEARAHLETVCRMEPESSLAQYDVARVLASQGKAVEARARFQQGVILASNRPEALAAFANFLMQLGRTPDARARLDEALALDPGDSATHMVFGNLLSREGNVEEAIAHYDAAVRRRPSLAPEVVDIVAKLRANPAQNSRQK